MIGNYLTTLNRPVEQDLQMIRDLGLDPHWKEDGFGATPAPAAELAGEGVSDSAIRTVSPCEATPALA
jgi:hypothetical protein